MTGTRIIESFDKELNRLRATLSEMAGLAETQLAQAVHALVTRDNDLAEQIIANDEKIDQLDFKAEKLAIEIIARRSPFADDLRELVASLKITNSLERIGDYAKSIAKRTRIMTEESPIRQVSVLPEMANFAQQMILDVMDAYINRDSAKAIDVWARDTRIDSLYNSLFRELLTYMLEKPQLITVCTHLLFIAKNIERIGDQATNIAEVTYYVIEGRHMSDDRPKLDETASARPLLNDQSGNSQ